MPPLRYWILATFLASAAYANLRGRVRFGWLRALTDYTVLLAPLNAVLYAASRVQPRPFLAAERFATLDVLRANWRLIRDEALAVDESGHIRAAAAYNDIGFNSFFRTGWARFYLKWYGAELPSARALCPRTVELLAGLPEVKAAMFASLPPGGRLVRHRDPYAGSLRYHLGLKTPIRPAATSRSTASATTGRTARRSSSTRRSSIMPRTRPTSSASSCSAMSSGPCAGGR